MPALQVKDCPADVYENLRICAAAENRSISQQALTIIESYLGMRTGSHCGADASFGKNAGQPQSVQTDYVAKRQRAFKRISSMRPIPISKDAPDTATLLGQIRQEEAR